MAYDSNMMNMLGGSGGFGSQGIGMQNLQGMRGQQQNMNPYMQGMQNQGQQQPFGLEQLQQLINPGGMGQSPQANEGQGSSFGNMLSGIWESLMGTPGKNISNYTPLQTGALNSQLLQGMLNSNFGGIENYARQNFQTQTLPNIAERFTAMGNGQRSSAFQNAVGSAGAGLESQLAALRSQYGMQQLQMGLRPQFDYMKRQPGFIENILPAIASIAGSYYGMPTMPTQPKEEEPKDQKGAK